MRLFSSTLQQRFLGGLLLIGLLTTTFFFMMLNSQMESLYLSEARSRASLMASHAEEIQNYVRKVLRPAVARIAENNEFVVEAMSTSYITRNIMEKLQPDDRDFTYRRVAINSRNPDSEVTEEDSLFFDLFLLDPASTEQELSVMVDGKQHLIVARPVYFSASCLRCHGNPDDAPDALLAQYGSERGFGREAGELGGLNIVSVSVGSATSAINKSVTVFALSFVGGMILLMFSVQGFFNRLVIQNLRRVAQILHQRFFQGENSEILDSLYNDVNIESMIKSIEAVTGHLSDARRQLRDYATNLERMVSDRTSDLQDVVQQRNADVQLFMHLLSDLNNMQEKNMLLRTSLHLIASHFNASRAVYVCSLDGNNYVEWPSDVRYKEATANAPDYIRLMSRLRNGEPAIEDDVWFVPVQTSGQARGMLALYWQQCNDGNKDSIDGTHFIISGKPDEKNFPLALAFGKQLGIALDNLESIDILLRQNQLLDSIVEGVSDPLILLERGTVPVLSNSSARALAMRLIDTEVSCVMSADQADTFPCVNNMLKHMELERLDIRQNIPLSREVVLQDGSSFYVSLHPVPDKGPQNLRVVVHIHETTDEKRIRAHMRQNDKLAAVGQLAAGLAHEINNPLGVIQCYAELLASTPLDEQGRADLSVIMQHVEQARTVLRDMLDFSRSHESRPCLCDIGDILHSLFDIFNAQGRSARIDMRLEVEPALPRLYLDKGMFEQVLVNLMLNAIDAVKQSLAPGEGIIVLRAEYDASSSSICVSVTDNGPGIPEKFLEKIFDPFFTTKEPGAGTGLGLTIAFGLVNDMGGRLEAQSPPSGSGQGNGTTFSIILPIEFMGEYSGRNEEYIDS